jgi:hypothetical protein
MPEIPCFNTSLREFLDISDGNWLTFRPIFAAQLVKAPYHISGVSLVIEDGQELFVITDDGDVFMKSLLISHYDGYLWILYLL